MKLITKDTPLSIGQYVGVQNDTSIRTKVKVHRIYNDVIQVEDESGAIEEFKLFKGHYCDKDYLPYGLPKLVQWDEYFEITWVGLKRNVPYTKIDWEIARLSS